MKNSSNSGKYGVISRIGKGGMAEVYKGQARTVGNLEKVVAIKRILPSLTNDKKFVGMFLDEARLSMSLNHANIVHTFDVGHADGTWFLVMEYVDGVNLKGLLEAARDKGQPIPVPAALYITAEVCKALAHAHNKVDEDGAPLGVVHRDVSPPNILISREGGVKLTDFGLAKVRSQLEPTEPGVVKGKFAYLSPDSINGEGVDSRADIFSLGIVLYEMLANRKLFEGETDMEVFNNVKKCHIPSIAPLIREREPGVRGGLDLGGDLDRILALALAPDRENRYQTALEFARDVARTLFRHQLVYTAFDLAKEVENHLRDGDGGRSGGSSDSDSDRDSFRVIGQMLQDELKRFRSSRAGAGGHTGEDWEQGAGDPDGGVGDGSRSLLDPAALLALPGGELPGGATGGRRGRTGGKAGGGEEEARGRGSGRPEESSGDSGGRDSMASAGNSPDGVRGSTGGSVVAGIPRGGGVTWAGFQGSPSESSLPSPPPPPPGAGNHGGVAVLAVLVAGVAVVVLALGIWFALG